MGVDEPEILLQNLLAESGIQPNDLQIYRRAMTHSSFLNEQGLPAWEGNERLEFLGDAVIGLVVTQALFEIYPEKKEGELSKIKSVVVSRATLAKCAREKGLARPLRLGVGETKSGGKGRHSILAAVCESFVGAIYLDLGFEAARIFCLRLLEPIIEEFGKGDLAQDDKSRLQELVQRRTGQIPRYRVVKSEGPDHDKWFVVEVSLRNRNIAQGEGSSKKNAEQSAAQNALALIETHGEDALVGQGDYFNEDPTC
jgi:ribonuclease-3